jgi:hypothetical protein
VKQKLVAGGEFDILTAQELGDTMKDIVAGLGMGVKFRNLFYQLPISGANFVAPAAGFGPEPGFIWDVRYINADCANAGTPGTTTFYLNNAGSGANAIANIANSFTVPTFFNKQLLIHPGELIVPTLFGTVAAPAQNLSISIGVIEVPLNHEGQLLL